MMVFEELQASFAVHKTFGSLPKPERACLTRAFIALKEGSLALHPVHFLAERMFVSFACGFTIWASVSRDGRKVAIDNLYRDSYGNEP